jgi:hypothetical protein
MKGHDYWLREPLRGYISEPSFSFVIILLFVLIYIYICLYGFDYYIPDILDYLCVTNFVRLSFYLEVGRTNLSRPLPLNSLAIDTSVPTSASILPKFVLQKGTKITG